MAQSFPIVGIGASAGGLEAFEIFFDAMPPDSGMAFVLVTHLDPSHATILPELIQKKTQMRVQEVTDNLKVEPNQVYIIPPNREMAILNGTLQLLELTRPRGLNLPIDTFLRSLAKDQADNAVCIILSGTGTDGTLGLRAIKGEGGMTMAQDLDSAKYDGMPRSAVATGLVDYILPPALMPNQVLSYTRHTIKAPPAAAIASEDVTMGNALQKIFILLRATTGHDFSLYKKNTICRRIERRMHVHQIDNIMDYVRYLQTSDREISTLFKELLIGVTNFFRDPEAFEILKNIYLPELLKNKPDDYVLRVWVPGCSSGEEAYSVAIILQECMADLGRHFNVQIFATDLDQTAIAVARAGRYPQSISADVTPARLKRFFHKEESHYQIKKSIREMVIFAPQNITKDPPFTKLDLLCCRNLLIYFNAELQKKILPIFYYSLKPDGLLFLGTSETIGQATDLFSLQEKKWKIFKRRATAKAETLPLSFPALAPTSENRGKETLQPGLQEMKGVNNLHLVKTLLAQSHLPPSVIIDGQANIIYIHGRIGRFLEPAEGVISSNILEMARPGLKAGLARALRKMTIEQRETVVEKLPVKDNGGTTKINLVVRPLSNVQSGMSGLLMVSFEEISSPGETLPGKALRQSKTKKSEDVQNLEVELQYTKENLQSAIEELETSNEELKSTNEELQSTNEELQSTNEELETSKEELQSLNEESATVNAELQHRIDELSKANDDMKNVLDSTEIATIFLDIDLGIRRFTPKVTELIPLVATDIGRPITHFSSKLKGVDLTTFANQVLKDLALQEVVVDSDNARSYQMRVRPYRTVNNVIDGVVMTFTDITKLKHLYQEAKRLAAVVKDSNDAITLQDFQGNIIAWNRGAERLYGYSEAEALTMNMVDIVPQEGKEAARALLARLQEHAVAPLIAERLKKDGTVVQVWLTPTRLLDEKGLPEFVATTERDIATLSKDAELLLVEGGGHGKG
ncbi:MAG: PAS domain-containing protein [Proteobacteria bacterium]|nr:PAS domain-containing protein [Pseudomonadota bacterium]MBU1639612.1 PAS domain-containing protein [Pseudomonadota bacterium]